MKENASALVDHAALLSRLVFDNQEKKILAQDILKIIQMIEKINEVDTENTLPLNFVLQDILKDHQAIMREDKSSISFSEEEITLNAPEYRNHHIAVPDVME